MEAKPEARRRRRGAAIFAGVALFGITGATAATLGGIAADDLGADVGTVASCDSDGVAVAFTNTYSATAGRYNTTAAVVSGIDAACDTQNMRVTLMDGTGASLGEGTVTVGNTGTETVTFTGADAEAVVGVAIVITG